MVGWLDGWMVGFPQMLADLRRLEFVSQLFVLLFVLEFVRINCDSVMRHATYQCEDVQQGEGENQLRRVLGDSWV